MKANVSLNGKGTISFEQTNRSKPVEVFINLYGLEKNHIHGVHIHEKGDLGDHCMNTGGHFNPYGKDHGNHTGDLINNVRTNKDGVVQLRYVDNEISLYAGKNNIIGRSIVIHKFADDKGESKFYERMSDDALSKFARERKYISGSKNFNREKVLEKVKSESTKSGNAGPRIACGLILKNFG